MKRYMIITPVILLSVFLILGFAYAQPPGSGYGPPSQGGWYCPYGGPYQGGYGMGPGMMGYGMMGPGYYGYYPQYRQPHRRLSEKDAKAIVKNYLNATRNPNLKLGKIKDEGYAYEAEIVTKKNGSLVDKILVNKNTGWMRSIY